MSLELAAILPHPPILIPTIGKENLIKLNLTNTAIKKISEEIKNNGIESILIISPHGFVQSKAFTMNLSPRFTCNFENFGDFQTKKEWLGDIGLSHRIREKLETKAPLQMITDSKLDHGSAIPLYLLTEKINKIKIMPIYYSGLTNEAHFKFGQLLKSEILYHNEKIAVIASGDLSHRLTKEAPAGYSSKGKKFDKRIVELLRQNKTKEIIKMDKNFIHEAGECGLKSILILLGIMDEIKHTPKILSYEAPFGVGYLTMKFDL